MMEFYGLDLLKQIQSAYQVRCQKALERGFDQEGNPYHWLYAELRIRLQMLQETLLYLEALPRFLDTAEAEKPYQYIMMFLARCFRQANLGTADASETPDPFFQDRNPYWRDIQEALEALDEPDLLQNLPLFFVYSCELVTRAVRLYFQIRESRIHAIDREKFDALMRQSASLPQSA